MRRTPRPDLLPRLHPLPTWVSVVDTQRAPEADQRPRRGAATHFKRYGILYAIVAILAVVVVAFPSVGGDDDDADGAANVDTGTSARTDDGQVGWRPASGDVKVGEGTTRGGVACEDGFGQIPDTAYALPCVAAFAGDNGGATTRGVTPDTVKIVRRSFPTSANSQAIDQGLRDAGFATDEEADSIRDRFISYLDENYELYGRKIEWIDYESQFSNATQEALGAGREGACADVTRIVEEIGAFAATGGSGNFAECAAERELLVFQGAAYFSETFYRSHHPHVWNTAMECERISAHLAEYIGKRLAGKPAVHAGSAAVAASTRSFATYVPDNDEYQRCTRITEQTLQAEYGVDAGPRYNYQLDISRFQQQALEAVIQFKAAEVTTLVLAADPFSTMFLTQAADEQDWHPEWLLIGVAGTDTDQFGRAYSAEQVEGHMFGLSQLSDTGAIFGASGEPGALLRKLDGTDIPNGTTGDLYSLVHIYNFLQAAGPDLTAGNIAMGVQTLPPLGEPDRPVGLWHYAIGSDGGPEGDHTAVDDSREVYWDPAAPSVDEPGKVGRWVATYDGKRFRNGEWPEEDPPVYSDAA